jgi:translation initiation factor 2 subunit 1
MNLGRQEWPEVGEIVVASVQRLESYGAYVNLDEYEGKEGLLHISEISSRWVRNIRNHVRQGQKVVLQVLRVDPRKGQVDLSLRRVSKDDKRKKIESWKKARKAETMFTQAAHDVDVDVEQLYETEGVKLVEEYGGLYEGLEAASKRGVQALTDAGVDEKLAEVLAEIAKDKIVIKGVTVTGFFEANSISSTGVEDVKQAFLSAEEVAEENDATISITSLGSPKYRIELEAEDYKKAENALEQVVEYTKGIWEDVDGSISFQRE